MTAFSPATAARTFDSSDRTPAITVVRGAARQTNPPAGRPAGFARRFVSALIRSLAAPHA